MPADVYQLDRGKVLTLRWLALILVFAVLFSLCPVVDKMHFDLETAPGWARAAVLLAAIQAAYIAWMLNRPDWASVWVVMLVFAGVAALYAVATAMAIAAPEHKPMLLGMGEVRYSARGWCAAVLLVTSLATYVCGRTSARWRRAYELEMTARSRRGRSGW